MNAPEMRQLLPDTQSEPDNRGTAIDAVGISELRYPLQIADAGRSVATIGTFGMCVHLPATQKGTHMSRFVELLSGRLGALDAAAMRELTYDMLEKLDARAGFITVEFPYFIEKAAPVSGARSMWDCDVRWTSCVELDGRHRFLATAAVSATSLCPCSKKISAYGAHNQRSMITASVELAQPLSIARLAQVLEQAASCQTFPLLKRIDEKHVTEQAYDNARFVEDIVRDAALALGAEEHIIAFRVDVENFESIHNHSAVAYICSPNWRAAS
ncbi:GTP cyclohydrolase FolE2 [Polaromonas sp.]|uniref:GTP cyclohydrolase FolE2 n=1 Tax=Polaromonas sp. TaxID=1869339 RepID=UPI0032667D3A